MAQAKDSHAANEKILRTGKPVDKATLSITARRAQSTKATADIHGKQQMADIAIQMPIVFVRRLSHSYRKQSSVAGSARTCELANNWSSSSASGSNSLSASSIHSKSSAVGVLLWSPLWCPSSSSAPVVHCTLHYYNSLGTKVSLQSSVCNTWFLRHKSLKNQGFSRPFHSIIQGPSSSRSFHSTQSYWYSRKDTNLRHSCMTFSKQFFYQLYSNYDRKFTQSKRQIPNFQGLPLFFQNNSRTFQFVDIQGLFKAGLEFKDGAGTLAIDALQQCLSWWRWWYPYCS